MPSILPDTRGYYGDFGGRYVPETLMHALRELEEAFQAVKNDSTFQRKFTSLLREYVGRPTPLYFAERLTAHAGGAQIYLKREDLCHTGAHKINNAIGQVLLTRMIGKNRIIAETGAGQHGVATATAAALLGLPCHVYMGSEDVKRQRANVLRMNLLGAEVISVKTGSQTLKDAINEAMRDWVTNVSDSHYVIGSAVGPHPFPAMVREFQAVIGRETRQQVETLCGDRPDVVVACVGGGSNAIGIFHPFVDDQEVELIGVEAGGRGTTVGDHAATLVNGSIGVLHGARSFMLQNTAGQVAGTHSVSAGLDYPGVGPEHAYLHATGRVKYTSVDDEAALEGFKLMSHREGIIPALETAHAIAYAVERARTMRSEQILVINLSGRGDKDLEIVEGLV